MTTDELLYATDVLSAAWSTRDELRTNFVSREQFLKTNITALENESIAKGVSVQVLLGYFPIVENP